MNIIALFYDIDYFLFLKDRQIIAYSNGRNSADWNLYIREPKKREARFETAPPLNKNFFLRSRNVPVTPIA